MGASNTPFDSFLLRAAEFLELHSHVANIGDVRSTTHSQLSGLESIDGILVDLDAGFRAAKS